MRYEFFHLPVSPPYQLGAYPLARVLLQHDVVHDFKVIDVPQHRLHPLELTEPLADDSGIQGNEQFERVTHLFRGDTELVQLLQTIAFATGGPMAQGKQAFGQYGKDLAGPLLDRSWRRRSGIGGLELSLPLGAGPSSHPALESIGQNPACIFSFLFKLRSKFEGFRTSESPQQLDCDVEVPDVPGKVHDLLRCPLNAFDLFGGKTRLENLHGLCKTPNANPKIVHRSRASGLTRATALQL